MEKKLLILGAGGHGKAVAEAAKLNKEWTHIAFIDDRWPQLKMVVDIPVVSDIKGLRDISSQYSVAIVAIGNNKTRLEWFNLLEAIDLSIVSIIHPSASVSLTAQIGKGTAVMALAVIGVDAKVGQGCIINAHSTVDHDVILDEFAHIGVGVHLAGGVRIGKRAVLQSGSCAGYNVIVADDEFFEPGTVLKRL